MTATIVGALVNAVLDPILIFGLGMELQGAAWASVAARAAIGVTALVPIVRHYGGFGRPDLASMLPDLRPVMIIAFPAILTQLATPVGQAYVTRAMAEFGEDAVAGMAIVGRLTPVAFAIIFALSGAIGPVIGQNFGAGQTDRVKGAFREGLIFTGAVVIVVSGLLFAARPLLEMLFALDGQARTLVFLFAGPLSLMWFFNGMIFVSNAACNNMGHPFYSTLVNWGRHTIGTIPFVIVFSAWFGAGGVLVGQAVGGVLFGLVAFVVAYRIMVSGGGDIGDDGLQKQARVFGWMHRNR